MNHLQRPTLWRLLQKVHNDERGAISIETILVLAVIAIPILIFILKFGWPKVKEIFEEGLENLEGASDEVTNPSS
jgi:Flp pilus assembly pilin Flp